jgi:hypothetical protein
MSTLVTVVIDTKVFASEKIRFGIFLKDVGLENVEIIAPDDAIYLKLQFFSKGDLLRYQICNVEQRYLHARSDVYFYDLEQSWDNEVDEYFRSDDY